MTIKTRSQRRSAISSRVFDDTYLFRYITEFIVEFEKIPFLFQGKDNTIPLLSPFLPLLLTFRSSREILDQIAPITGGSQCRFISKPQHFAVSVSLIKWAISMGCVFGSSLCIHAASKNDVAFLKWARSQSPPYPWGSQTFRTAIINGSTDALEYMYKRDLFFRHHRSACLEALAVVCGRNDIPDHQGVELVNSDKFAVLRWLRSKKPPYPFVYHCMFMPGFAEDFEVLDWLRDQEEPCPWPSKFLQMLVANGNLGTVKWARSKDPPCPWEEEVCVTAAAKGEMDILKWIRAQDPPCPWGLRVVFAAIVCDVEETGLSILKWLRSQDPPCPWDFDDCLKVATLKNKSLVVEWMHSLM